MGDVFPEARYQGPPWKVWCAAMATGERVLIRPPGVPDAVLLTVDTLRRSTAGNSVEVSDLMNVRFGGQVTGLGRRSLFILNSLGENVRLPVSLVQGKPVGRYLLPQRYCEAQSGDPWLFQRLDSLDKGPTLYMAVKPTNPVLTSQSLVMLIDPFLGIHEAHALNRNRTDAPIEFS